MIKLFLFDLGKVLIDFDFGIALQNLKRYGPVDSLQIYSLFRNSSLAESWDKGVLDPDHFFDAVRKELKLKISIQEFVPIWNDIFTEIEGMVPLVERCHRDHKVVILSNTNPWHADYVRRRFPWLGRLDGFIASCDVHLLKPDAKIFLLALEKAGVDSSETLYVDDLEENVRAARALGMDAIRFRNRAALLQELQKRHRAQTISNIFPVPSRLVPEV